MLLTPELQKLIKGEVVADEASLRKYSRDASLFEVVPQAVVHPKDAEDLGALVRFAAAHKKEMPELSLTARAAGSDMSGGPLSESLVLDFTRHFTRIKEVTETRAVTEPGVYYRNFEAETLKKGAYMPSYPASRELCAVGGMVANNAGGEKTLKYGKTEQYVEALKAVLSDGNEYMLRPLTWQELDRKFAQDDFEGEIYRKMYALLEEHHEAISRARPNVSKNSAGYYLWNVWDRERGIFDLTKLFTGSQGTLGIITEITFRLVPKEPASGMLVIFLKDLAHVPELVREVLRFKPSSFESFDDHTLKLALAFFAGFVKTLGTSAFALALRFLPEFFMALTGGVPKLVMLVEFEEVSEGEVQRKLAALYVLLKERGVAARVVRSEAEAQKYWVIRRESFNLLRHRVKDKKTAPFVDDVIVRPEELPVFLPKLYEILDRYNFLYTIAGHVGDGNFHVIPLMNLRDEAERAKIFPALEEVHALVFRHGGSMTAEHNDGIIRSPYVKDMYGPEMYELFLKTKEIFDPQGIFNPGKKVGGTREYALAHMRSD